MKQFSESEASTLYALIREEKNKKVNLGTNNKVKNVTQKKSIKKNKLLKLPKFCVLFLRIKKGTPMFFSTFPTLYSVLHQETKRIFKYTYVIRHNKIFTQYK